MVVTGSTRNRFGGHKLPRGFESPSLRHYSQQKKDNGTKGFARHAPGAQRMLGEFPSAIDRYRDVTHYVNMIKKYCFSGRDVRAAEGARLEIVCMPTKVYRGFDSRSLRQKNS